MPKTIRNQFDKKLTVESLMEAHILSRKGKNSKKEVASFNMNQEIYVRELYEELKAGTYKHGDYKVFYITKPKRRKIEASIYKDRIVHRWIVDNFLKEYFVKSFIYHSYACIKDRGMHKASLDVQAAMRHMKRATNNRYYILKMDIAKYFQNINKDILLSILERKISDPKLMALLKDIIYSTLGKKGIPIGNYTSQIFANIYLNEVDQYIKHELKIKNYFRYMDDGLILVKTKQEAIDALEKIRTFLREKLKLELNNKTQIFKGKQGVNFVGYKITPYRLKIRNRGKKQLKAKIKLLKEQIKEGNMNSTEAQKYLRGHMGYMKLADTYNLEHKLFYCDGWG